ncbi:sulfotransferase [Nakamurella flava]|uniref:Sulfotransferase n=1 Tax=Nakamurella flava TaxID=2576308 RepID=A0A4U6QMI4_9ACTN|nr:sulfotransferase [Nakamurella flava]TKV61631.1 sulfotransferase [Nakamurella flava]
MSLPDFLIIGSPKAGSTALHAALAQHPQLFLSTPKEPKFFLCEAAPPDPAHQRGPGDAHSAQEWVWRRDRYEALFDAAPPGTLTGESTPFYLWDSSAHERIRRVVPQAKLIAVVRDPIDRAYSNWTHLWCDGLEPEADFLRAVDLEEQRIAAGYAPFWRYLEMGRYGEQLQHLYSVFPREQVFVLRYRRLIDDPATVLDEICTFLGVRTGELTSVPRSNVSNWVPNTPVNQVLRQVVRAGAALGAHVPPQIWRGVEKPLLGVLHRGGRRRPSLTAEQRAALLPRVAPDVHLLSEITGVDHSDWLNEVGRGSFGERASS